MKKFLLFLFSILIVSAISGVASADTIYEYDYSNPTVVEIINTSDPYVAENGWFELSFDDNGVLENDYWKTDYLTITLAGTNESGYQSIDIWLSFESTHEDAVWVSWYKVPDTETGAFTLTLDILNDAFLHNDEVVRDYLGDVSLADFVGIDTFWVGYGCHFTHLSTSVSFGASPVPEPATMLLLGSGLVGIAGFGRRKLLKKKKNA